MLSASAVYEGGLGSSSSSLSLSANGLLSGIFTSGGGALGSSGSRFMILCEGMRTGSSGVEGGGEEMDLEREGDPWIAPGGAREGEEVEGAFFMYMGAESASAPFCKGKGQYHSMRGGVFMRRNTICGGCTNIFSGIG